MNLNDDKALLKIINRNGVFYLESAAYYHHADDLAKNAASGTTPGETSTTPRPVTSESMYLVVRSLKHQNEKVVSSSPDSVNFILLSFGRTTKYTKETS